MRKMRITACSTCPNTTLLWCKSTAHALCILSTKFHCCTCLTSFGCSPYFELCYSNAACAGQAGKTQLWVFSVVFFHFIGEQNSCFVYIFGVKFSPLEVETQKSQIDATAKQTSQRADCRCCSLCARWLLRILPCFYIWSIFKFAQFSFAALLCSEVHTILAGNALKKVQEMSQVGLNLKGPALKFVFPFKWIWMEMFECHPFETL